MHDRSHHIRILVLLFVAVATTGRRARADEGGEPPPAGDKYRSTVHALPPQTFVTAVDATQPSTRLVSVADLIEGTTGVFVRSRGGLGSFTSVSIRGSESNEVAVLVDGMPLGRAAAGVIDLSSLSAAGLERVEIYRGVPPIELGAEAVGGAINLVTRRGTLVPELRVSAGVGSFGARSASAGWSGSDHQLRIAVSAAYNGATGDFTYYDTAGTLYNQSDDRISVRHNNGFDQGTLDATVAAPHWRLGAHGFLKQQGAPGVGLAGAESLHARLVTGRVILDGDSDGHLGRALWRAAASVVYERLLFANPAGEEVGPFGPNVTDAEALTEGLYLRLKLPVGTHQRLTALADARAEERWPHDLLYPPQSGSASFRVVGGAGVEDELRFFAGALTITAGVRLDGDHNRLSVPMSGPLAPTSDLEPTGRVTVRALVTPWLALRAAAGRFVRFPTLLELFGDGAFVLPHPLLAPEKAWAGDVGGTLCGRARWLEGSLEAAFFGRHVDDPIVYLPSSRAAAATNLGPARMLGVELRAAAVLGRFFSARVEYAFVDARELGGAGGQIPGRPQNELTLRADVKRAPFGLWYELSFVDKLYRDPANDAWVPERTLHAIGATFEHKFIQLSVEIRNLADLRVIPLPAAGGATVPYPLVDYFNYPLPGRAIYATVVFRK